MPGWNKSVNMIGRLDLQGKLVYSSDGRSWFRPSKDAYPIPIIKRDTPILGAVCLGEYEREAIFVPPTSPALDRLYREAKSRASEYGHVRRDRVLRSVYETIRSKMRYDDASVDSIVNAYKAENDGLISLDAFLENGVGVCRHMGLACGAIAERFMRDSELRKTYNHLRGSSSFDRNSNRGSGHAWYRYKSNDGTPVILDVAQGFFGLLNTPRTVELIREQKLWPYNRPDDSFIYPNS